MPSEDAFRAISIGERRSVALELGTARLYTTYGISLARIGRWHSCCRLHVVFTLPLVIFHSTSNLDTTLSRADLVFISCVIRARCQIGTRGLSDASLHSLPFFFFVSTSCLASPIGMFLLPAELISHSVHSIYAASFFSFVSHLPSSRFLAFSTT